MLYIHVMACSS